MDEDLPFSRNLVSPTTTLSAGHPQAAHLIIKNMGGHLKHEADRMEYNEQFYAQVAALAVEIPNSAIKEGIRKTLNYHRVHRKTKQEWNQERVRDVHIINEKKGRIEKVGLDQLELHGSVGDYSSFTDVPTDLIPYLRDYVFDSFSDTMRRMNRKHVNFGAIRVLDLCGQLIGDAKLSDLCYQLRRCPLEILNLSKNNVSDKGMTQLASCLRSLGNLEALILQHNNITDSGVEAILQPNTYSPTMRKLDISCNTMGTRAAFWLGRMFRPGCVAALDALYLGGRVGNKGWGDDFIRILVNQLCKKGARPVKVLSYPQAALTPEGVRAIAALVVCAPQLETLNLSHNSLQEPQSRRFLRDAFRVSKSLKNVFLGAGGIRREEREELEVAAASLNAVTWKEKVDLAYNACAVLNVCGKLGHALEVVITNNWQAVKPHDFPVLTPYVATKEDIAAASNANATKNSGDPEKNAEDESAVAASVPIPIPLTFLTSNMRLSSSLASTLAECDNACNYITTLKRSFFACRDWLQENIESYRMVGEQKVVYKKYMAREKAAEKRREYLLITLEKWTSTSLAKIMVGVDGKIRKVREKRARGKQAQAWSKKGKKAGKLNVEAITMGAEELHASYIELADSLQVLIGVSFAIKLQFQEIQSRILSGKQNFDTTRRGAVAKEASKVASKVATLLPYSELLGFASLYIHYIYVAGPEEIERMKKSLIAFERDQKKQADAAAKESKRLLMASVKKIGHRFRVMRPHEIEERNAVLGFDPQERAEEAARIAAELRMREEEEARQRAEALRIRAEEDAGGGEEESDFEEEDSAEEDVESEEEAPEPEKVKVVRERTRFLVPKREMQRKFEGLYTDDLIADKAGTKNAIVAFSRSNRNHIVTRIPFPLNMPSEDLTRQVPVDILIEIEEERIDALQPLSRLDSIRPYIRLQERIRHKKAMNRYQREETL